ncbi:MAG: DUF4260 domain-containing protein [Aliarcobacter sp.]|nr:DUF4260 domain-containing protein [Aliarcobacter sp.]
MSFVTGKLNIVLRIEGLCILLTSILFYHQLNADWGLFAWLFLIPDFAFLGYIFNAKIGALAYNCTHSLIGSCFLLGLGMSIGSDITVIVSLIWFAHIGFDRALGYGLKYASSFNDTHLGKIGIRKNT